MPNSDLLNSSLECKIFLTGLSLLGGVYLIGISLLYMTYFDSSLKQLHLHSISWFINYEKLNTTL